MKGGIGHTKLTKERSIWFIWFEIKSVFVFYSTIFKLTDLFMLYLFIQNVHANKKLIRTKAIKWWLRGQIVIESHSFSKILAELLTPREAET